MKKTRSNKGFTLAELLIVVAIIAVLVAIAVPVFNTQLEKSREAVDISNFRAAYAVAATDVLTSDFDAYTKTGSDAAPVYTGFYNPTTSEIDKTVAACIKAKVTDLQSATPEWPTNATFNYSGSPSTTNGIKVVISVTATGTTITLSDAAS